MSMAPSIPMSISSFMSSIALQYIFYFRYINRCQACIFLSLDLTNIALTNSIQHLFSAFEHRPIVYPSNTFFSRHKDQALPTLTYPTYIMPFWVNSQRRAPAASKHTPTPGPASSRTRGPTTTNKIVSKGSSGIQTPSPGPVPQRGTVYPDLSRHKKLIPGNKPSKTREKIERKRDQPGYKAPKLENRQLSLPLRPIGYRKPGEFGSASAHRIQASLYSDQEDPTGQYRKDYTDRAEQTERDRASDRATFKRYTAAADAHVQEMNHMTMRSEKQRVKDRRSRDLPATTQFVKLMSQSEAKTQYHVALEAQQGMIQNRRYDPRTNTFRLEKISPLPVVQPR
jgi:hypothetical protein